MPDDIFETSNNPSIHVSFKDISFDKISNIFTPSSAYLIKNPSITFFGNTKSSNTVLNDIPVVKESSDKTYTDFNSPFLPIDLGDATGKEFKINLNELSKKYDFHLLGKSYIVFPKKIPIRWIKLINNNDLIDKLDSDLINTAQYLNFESDWESISYENYTVPLMFFFGYFGRQLPLICIDYSQIYIIIKFKQSVTNIPIKLISKVYYLCSLEKNRFMNIGHEYLIKQWGMNYHREKNIDMGSNKFLINLSEFNLCMDQIIIKIKPKNKQSIININGRLLSNGEVISLINTQINRLNLKKYEVTEYKPNIYVVPFCIYPHEYVQPSGHYSGNNSLVFEAEWSSSTNPQSFDILIWAPKFNVIRIMGNMLGLAY